MGTTLKRNNSIKPPVLDIDELPDDPEVFELALVDHNESLFRLFLAHCTVSQAEYEAWQQR